MSLAPGTTVGRYQILEPLGQGGMATVYKAFQPSLQREVALKVLRPGYAQDREFRERFEREAIAIAKLRHPHIVQVFDFEVAASGEYVLAMEFLEGGTLKERLTAMAAAGRGMDPAQSVRIVGEVAEALAYAHEKGVVHRDVKPSNVMLTAKDWAVVTDFGIARILGATSHTQTGVGIGTPEYMAPEQGQGSGIDHRADIYSLGAMAYELLTGRVPYQADTPLAVVLAHIKDPLPLPSKVNPTIGKGLERALLRALAKDPSQRFDSATAFSEALKAGLAEDTRGGTMPTVVVRTGAAAPTPRRAPAAPKQVTLAIPPVLAQRPVIAGAAAAVVLALVVGGVAVGPFRGSPEPTGAPTAAPTQAATTAAPPTPIPTSAGTPRFAVPAKGKLIYEAKLDGSGADARTRVNGDPSTVAVRQTVGAIEFELLRPSMWQHTRCPSDCTFASATFMMPRVITHVAELDVAITPGSDLTLHWFLYNVRDQGYFVDVRTKGFDGKDGIISIGCLGETKCGDALSGSPFRIDGSQAGRTFTLAAVLEEKQITLLLDQRELGRMPAAVPIVGLTSPGVQVMGPLDLPGMGKVRITGARFYELPGTAATSTASPAVAAATPRPVTPTPAPATAAPAAGPRSVQMEKATFSASREKAGVIVSNFPIGTEVVLVSSKHESGFEQAINIRFSTSSDPFPIRFDWSGPIGSYTMRVTAAGTPYDLTFTVTQ